MEVKTPAGPVPFNYIEVESHADSRGTLHVSPLPEGFTPKSQFCVTNLNGEVRGNHAHWEATQIIWVAQGHLRMVSQRNGVCNVTDALPKVALVVPPKTWITLCGFSPDCVYHVWSDKEYDESDYIRDPEEFARLTGQLPRPVFYAEDQVYLGDASWSL